MLTEPMRGHEGLVAGRFMKAFGSPNRAAWDPFGQDALLAACEAVHGVRDLPEYDIANARYLLSFSGDFLETWVSPVHYAEAFGRMRGDRETIAREIRPLRPAPVDDRRLRRPVPADRPRDGRDRRAGDRPRDGPGQAHRRGRRRGAADGGRPFRVRSGGASRSGPGSTPTTWPPPRRSSPETSRGWRSAGRPAARPATASSTTPRWSS